MLMCLGLCADKELQTVRINSQPYIMPSLTARSAALGCLAKPVIINSKCQYVNMC